MVSDRPIPADDMIPLVLDVDGTLLKTDLLFECFWAALGQNAGRTLKLAATRFRRPARLKHELAAIARPDIELLPLRQSLLERALAARDAGRSVHLVSGSDRALVEALGERLGFPGPHYGSNPDRNLTAAAKGAFLEQRFGVGGYDYAGNAAPDLEAWTNAREVIAVTPSGALGRQLAALGKPVTILAEDWSAGSVLRELRPHQWIKNLLLFLPLLAAHQFGLPEVARVLLAMIAFSLGASSIYILNDLLDLDADRRHPEKRHRPIASGALPIAVAMLMSTALALLALALALAVGPPVAALTLLYMAGSLSYSLWFKKRRWLDVFVLAGLFMLRVLTGAVAAQITVPPILLGFGFTVFLVLACVKRITALSRLPFRDHLPGRGYAPADLLRLERVAYAVTGIAVLAFLIYVFSPWAQGVYDRPFLLGLAAVPVAVWLLRMIRLSSQGQEDYDPVSFVLHDKLGFAIMLAGLLLAVLAA